MGTELAQQRRQFEKAAESVVGPKRLSVSFQRSAEQCPLAAQMRRELDQAGDLGLIGSVFHEVAAAVSTYARWRQLETVEADDAAAICERVLAAPDDPVPLPVWAIKEVRWLVREWVGRQVFPVWADTYDVERLVVHELDGERLSARLDLTATSGAVAWVKDWKTGFNMPTRQEMAVNPKARAGLTKYAWHVAQDHPDVHDFVLGLVFPRFGGEREVTITREEVEQTELDLSIGVARIRAAYRDGTLPAKAGSWCSHCPAPGACSKQDERLPAKVTTLEQAEKVTEAIMAGEALIAQLRTTVQGFLNETGIPYVEAGDKRLGYFGGGERTTVDRKQIEKLGLLPLLSTTSESKPSFTFRSGTKK